MSLDRPDRPEEAETLFAAWAVRAEAGEAVRIEELLEAHPEHKEALTRLHEDWKLFAPLLGRAVPGMISETSGIVLAPITSHGKGDVEGPSPELIERLGINIPDSGRYRFRSVLGRGGGGVVLKVWDTKLNRALAMKVVLGRDEERPDGSTPRVDSRTLSRFVDEARIASQLNHPGIVPVHELGTDESGRAFFTMKLVKGEDLSKIFEHVKTGHDGWNQTRALNVLLRVCESLAFAHERGVIHRDLKPANIMVGRHGEVYVMDWGLARVLGEEDKRDVRVQPPPRSSALLTVRGRRPESDADSPLYTMDGDVVGTPAYMAPEQAAGRLDLIAPHSDVYAVGAMLYHLLAGHMPYVPEGARLNNYAVWQRVQEGPPSRLENAQIKIPAELVAICEKALCRNAADRYPNTQLLADDLQAYLEMRVVGAYEAGTWASARKWIKRNRLLAYTLATSLVVIMLSGAGLTWLAVVLKERKAQLDSTARDLTAAQAESNLQSERAKWRSIVSRAQLEFPEDAAKRAMVLREVPKDLDDIYLENRANEIATGEYLREYALRGHEGPVTDVEWSPNGEKVLTASADHTARVWNSNGTGLPIVLRGHDCALTRATWSHDGARIATASENGRVVVWQFEHGMPHITVSETGQAPRTVAWSPTNDRLLVVDSSGLASVYDVASTGVLSTSTQVLDNANQASWSPEGDRVLAVLGDGGVRIVGLDNAAPDDAIVLLGMPAASACWDPNGLSVALGLASGWVYLWTPSEKSGLVDDFGLVSQFLLSALGLGEVYAITPSHGKEWRHRHDGNAVRSVKFRPEGGHVFAVSGHSACMISVDGDKEASNCADHEMQIKPVVDRPYLVWGGVMYRGLDFGVLSPNGMYYVSTVGDNVVEIWFADGNRGPVLRGHGGRIRDADWSPDGERIVTASEDSTARIWSMKPSAEPQILPIGGGIHAGAWSPDGALLVGGDVCSPAGNLVQRLGLEDDIGSDKCRVFGADGEAVLSLSYSTGSIRMCSLKAPSEWSLVCEGGESMDFAVFSPDRTRIAKVVGASARIEWIGQDRVPVALCGPEDMASTMAWSPDGRRIAVGYQSGVVVLFDAEGGDRATSLCSVSDRISCLSWSSNGSRLVVAYGRTVQSWPTNGIGDPILLPSIAGEVVDVMYSPVCDKVLAVVRSVDDAMFSESVQVWNADWETLQTVLQFPPMGIGGAAWSPDGRMIAASDGWGNVRCVWHLEWKDLNEHLWNAILDILSVEERMLSLGETESEAMAKYEAQRVEMEVRRSGK